MMKRSDDRIGKSSPIVTAVDGLTANSFFLKSVVIREKTKRNEFINRINALKARKSLIRSRDRTMVLLAWNQTSRGVFARNVSTSGWIFRLSGPRSAVGVCTQILKNESKVWHSILTLPPLVLDTPSSFPTWSRNCTRTVLLRSIFVGFAELAPSSLLSWQIRNVQIKIQHR